MYHIIYIGLCRGSHNIVCSTGHTMQYATNCMAKYVHANPVVKIKNKSFLYLPGVDYTKKSRCPAAYSIPSMYN